MTAASSELSARAQRLADTLASWPRQRVQLVELWSLLDEVDPTSRMDVHRRRILSGLIAELAGTAAGSNCPLPLVRPHGESPASPIPYRRRETSSLLPTQAARLASVSCLGARHWPHAVPGDTMEQVNCGSTTVATVRGSLPGALAGSLRRREGARPAVGNCPIRPRAAHLGLSALPEGSTPLHCESAGDGDVLLVMENSDTFDSLLTVLRGRDGHRVGLVGWGAGTGFEASVLSIPLIGRLVSEIRYFGDLDENGLRIPANASTIAQSEGLAPVGAGLRALPCPSPTRRSSARSASALARGGRQARELARSNSAHGRSDTAHRGGPDGPGGRWTVLPDQP